ncbi:hypothetical protein [Paractinoplanes globisporus]|uniref:Aminoglycoside phosphotransferase n=1 Tax=Paractinoplanes globisporus TaxID=113565 RepID=A0ABW6W8U3_9ACTN|nr:hypothetical protein [Actinoplanes globisporus]
MNADRPWLDRVPMPAGRVADAADQLALLRLAGSIGGLGSHPLVLPAAEPPSAMMAADRVAGPMPIRIAAFPAPDIRIPLKQGDYAVWRYDGENPVPAVAKPTTEAVRMLRETAAGPWPPPLSARPRAEALGRLPLDDLLGLLAHPPESPDTPHWQDLKLSTPTYWYRVTQPWTCLGILRHREDEPWATSTRRRVLIDLAFGVEDWVADSALLALVTAAHDDPARRAEVRELARARLDEAAVTAASRPVTIAESLAQLMLITPGCTADDRARARSMLAPASSRLADN